MGAYNFKERFAMKVESGEKTHTIRARRKHPEQRGNTIHCFAGMRTKNCRSLGRFVCTKVESIAIFPAVGSQKYAGVVIGVEVLADDEKEALARRDGFRDFADMMEFWQGRLPFVGEIIHWRYEQAA